MVFDYLVEAHSDTILLRGEAQPYPVGEVLASLSRVSAVPLDVSLLGSCWIHIAGNSAVLARVRHARSCEAAALEICAKGVFVRPVAWPIFPLRRRLWGPAWWHGKESILLNSVTVVMAVIANHLKMTFLMKTSNRCSLFAMVASPLWLHQLSGPLLFD